MNSTAVAIDLAIQLIQALITTKANAQIVSDIIAKRIAEQRTSWTAEELAIISNMESSARTEAVDAVDKLPE